MKNKHLPGSDDHKNHRKAQKSLATKSDPSSMLTEKDENKAAQNARHCHDMDDKGDG